MTDGTQRAPEVTPDLRLRAERPRVTRLSRKALIGLGGAVGLAVAAALIYALQTRRGDQAAKELYTTENRTTAEGVTALPRDYTGIPRLGPPLPGDLGRPILNAQNQGQPVPPTGPLPQPGVTPEEQRRLQEIEAARLSKLFASTEFRATPSLPATAAANATSGTTLAVPAEAPPLDPNSMQNMQDRKLAFVNGPVDRRTVSADRLANPASPYVVQAGTVIPAALITGIHSDLPGQVTAQVTEHVYDTPTGKFLLIPQGSRLIGQYDSQIAFGQKRVLLIWNRIMLPDGKSIVLERQQAADAQGFSGTRGRGRLSLVGSRQGGCALHLARHRHRTRIKRRRKRSRAGATSRLPGFDQQHWPAARAPPAQHPADAHHPPGLPGARDRQP